MVIKNSLNTLKTLVTLLISHHGKMCYLLYGIFTMRSLLAMIGSYLKVSICSENNQEMTSECLLGIVISGIKVRNLEIVPFHWLQCRNDH